MKFSLLFCLLFSALTVCAQQAQMDSLLKVLPTAKDDTTRVNLLIELSDQFFNSNPDSMFLFANEGLKIAQSAGYLDGEIRSKEKISNYWWAVGDYATAVKLLLPVLEYYKAKQDPEKISEIYSVLLNAYRDQGDYNEALHYSSLMLATIPMQLDFVVPVANAMKGSVYFGMNKFDSAHFYFTKALFNPQHFSEGWIFLMNGRLYAKLNKTDTAFGFYRKAVESLKAVSNYKDLAGAFISTGLLYEQTGNTDSAIYYGMQALEIARDKKFNKEKVDCYLLLSTAFEKLNTKTALDYYKQALTVKDSLFSQDKQKQLLSYKFNEELRQSDIRNARQQALDKNKIVLLLVLLLFVVLVAIILVRNNRHKQKLNVLLQQQKEEIQSSLKELKATQSQLIQSEKMASLGELTAGIAHEIQNPLNFVNNFSEINKELLGDLGASLEQGNLEEAKAIRNDLLANEEKIHHHGNRADGIVKGMLQHSRSSPGIKEKTDLNKLVDEYVRLAYNGLKAKDKLLNVSLVTDFDATIGEIPVIPQEIGRVILNLVNNAYYAVNEKSASSVALAKDDKYEPTVSIGTKKLVNKIEVHISDNGNGIPQHIIDKIFQPFFTTKPTGQGTGLGLSIAYDIIKAHGGEIRVESKAGEGADFVFTLPA